MGLIDCSFDDFLTHIKKGEKMILCYGAGMLPLYIEPLLAQYGLLPYIRLFIDGSREKEGKTVFFQNKQVEISMPGRLKTLDAKKHVILITAERYREILNQLQDRIDLRHWECYAWPLLNLSFYKNTISERAGYGKTEYIPKVIHYIWFGKKGRSERLPEERESGPQREELFFRCVESWKKYCPDYEIIEWNETNYNIHKNRYIGQAYERRKWAYVSDYARLDILYRYGGIYLDTDVELWKSMDELLTTEAFLCFGEWPVPNSGAGIGCIKGHPIVREMMNTRENLDFIQEDGSDDPYTNSNYEMQTLMRHGFRMDFTCQTKDGMTLYPPDVIAPASVTGRDSFVTERSIGIHYCNNSWRSGAMTMKKGEKSESFFKPFTPSDLYARQSAQMGAQNGRLD